MVLRLLLGLATKIFSSFEQQKISPGSRVTVAELMSLGGKQLSRTEVMDGVPEMIPEVQVEATFPDGTKLVTVHNPIP